MHWTTGGLPPWHLLVATSTAQWALARALPGALVGRGAAQMGSPGGGVLFCPFKHQPVRHFQSRSAFGNLFQRGGRLPGCFGRVWGTSDLESLGFWIVLVSVLCWGVELWRSWIVLVSAKFHLQTTVRSIFELRSWFSGSACFRQSLELCSCHRLGIARLWPSGPFSQQGGLPGQSVLAFVDWNDQLRNVLGTGPLLSDLD